MHGSKEGLRILLREFSARTPVLLTTLRMSRYFRPYRIENPAMGGVALDYCLTWVTDCGKPGAYCRAAGYAAATNFTPRPRAQQTYVIGSGQVCNGDFCTAFGSVTCQAER